MFNAIPIKLPVTLCTEIEKSFLKYMWKHKIPQIAKAILSKKSNAGGITIPDFKLYYRQYHNNKNSMELAQKQTWRPMDQNRRSHINPCIYSQLIFDKGAQNTWWRKDSLFNKCCWENWISTFGRLKLDPCIKINTKWITVLNIILF
jgi:hypothetical protein